MDIHRTEEEQIEAIKHFFHKHGTNVLLGFALFLALFFGQQWWQSQQQHKSTAASAYYNELRLLANEDAISAEKTAAFDDVYGKLITEFPKSIYASYASLLKAKNEVNAGNLDKAAATLAWVIDADVNKEIVTLANLRLASVYFAQNNNEKALALLDQKAAPFSSAYEELRGDIYVDMKENEKALAAYKASKSFKSADAQYSNKMLDMKISSLETSANDKVFDTAVKNEASVNTETK